MEENDGQSYFGIYRNKSDVDMRSDGKTKQLKKSFFSVAGNHSHYKAEYCAPGKKLMAFHIF